MSQTAELVFAIAVLAGAVWVGWRTSQPPKSGEKGEAPKRHAPTPKCAEASGETDLEQSVIACQHIVRAYAAVFEKAAAMGNAIPESLLPCQKETVKAAFKVCFLVETNTELVEVMKVNYMFLAKFVPDDVAAEVAEVSTALQAGDSEAFLRVGRDKLDTWNELNKRALDEMERRADELHSFLEQHQIES